MSGLDSDPEQEPQPDPDAMADAQEAVDGVGDGNVDDPGPETTDPVELAAQLDLLREENRRLRAEYARAKRASYRRTALGFAVLGLVAVVGGALFPGARTVLLALGGTGLFTAVLVAYLTPERFVAAETGERVYAARAATAGGLRAELGLADDALYVPTPDGIRLYIPRRADADLPERDALTATFVVGAGGDAARGVTLHPTGAGPFDAFERTLQGPLAEDLPTLGGQLSDGLTDGLELVEGTRVEADRDDGRLTVGIVDSGYGVVDRPDHPVVSFLAVGVATALDAPVRATVGAGDDRVDETVTVRRVSRDDARDE